MKKENIHKTEQKMNHKFFEEYHRLGGKSTEEIYQENLDIFIELTMAAFVNGEPPYREQAMKNWYKFIGSKKEGNLYFDSVDNIAAYT